MGGNQSKPPKHQRRYPSPTHSPPLPSKPFRAQQPRLRPATSLLFYSSGDRNTSKTNIKHHSSVSGESPILIEDGNDEEDNNDWPSIDFRDHHANGLLKSHFSESLLSDDLPSQPPVFCPPSLSSVTSSLSSVSTTLFSTLSLPSTISSVQSIQSKYDITLPTASPISTINNPSAHTVTATHQQCQPPRFDTDYLAALVHYHGLSPSRTSKQQQPDYVKAWKLFQKAATTLPSDLIRYPEHSTEIVGIIADASYHLGEMYFTGKGVSKPDSTKAMEYLRFAADNDHMLAQYMVAHYSQYADNLPEAIDQYRRSSLQGYIKAMAALGILLVKHYKRFPTLFDEALKWLELAAEKDEATAILQLAYLYEEGLLVIRNIQLSFKLYEKYLALIPSSLVANHADLHRLMGLHYREGSGNLETDYQAALRHLQIATETGLASAQRSLGFMYQLGLGIPVDTDAARDLFRLAASQGDVLALGALGNLYRSSKDNLEEALQCYRRAAESGSAPALMSLANLLVELDRPTEAEKVLERLIKDPTSMYHTKALLHLGLLRRDMGLLQSLNDPTADYKLGQMVIAAAPAPALGAKDEALTHYLRAAKAGHVEAMYQCADILNNHRKDPASAYHWYTQAASQGHPMAQICEALYHMNRLFPVRTKDYPRAEALLREAVRKKPAEANVHLAIVIKDTRPAEARERFTSAACMGNTTAMRHLATMLAEDSNNAQQAFLWLQKAANLKDPRAMVALSEYYEKGRGCDTGEPSIPKALECLQEAEALCYMRASFNIATLFERQSLWENAASKYDWIAAKFPMKNQYGWFARLLKYRLVVLHKVGDVAETYRLLQTMIKDPLTPESLIEPYELLGMCCEYGLGIQCDLATATQWYEKAIHVTLKPHEHVDLNQERARCRLASLYFKQDNNAAALSCLRALEPHLDKMRSHSSSETVTQAREARFLLGYLLLHGPDPHVQEARHWLTEAADQGHLNATYELGKLALRENDYVEARHRFDQGDFMGHASSKREMALLVLQDGVDDDATAETVRCLLEDAIDMGDMDACYELGKLYETNPKCLFPSEHPMAAFELYARAGKQVGHRLARISAGEVLYYHHRDENRAQAWFALEPDHWFSQFRMVMITDGSDVTQRLEKLLPVELPEADTHERLWWCKAAQVLGSHAAANDDNGVVDVDVDVETAIAWYTLAADLSHNNHVPAMLALAELYMHRLKDEASALEWYRHAAIQNDSTALYQMGIFHREGKGGLEKNAVVAANYLKQAAAQDHPDAMFQLGETYWQLRNYQKGWEAYKDSADKHGCLPALRAVGFLYDLGFSMVGKDNTPFTVPQDKNKAILYFCRAAEMDDIESMIMLGQYHEQNPIEALGIYQQAATTAATATSFSMHDSSNNHALLEFAIGRLFHLMANGNAVLHQEKLHQTAYERFERAVEASAKDDDDDDDGSNSNSNLGALHMHAEMMLTLYHLYGWHPPAHDPVQGLQALLRMDQKGDLDFQVTIKENLARCYENAIGTDKNLPLALVQWKCLCELGISHALTAIEEYHKDGWASDADLQSARRAFQASQAFNGHGEGQEETTSMATSTSSYNN